MTHPTFDRPSSGTVHGHPSWFKRLHTILADMDLAVLVFSLGFLFSILAVVVIVLSGHEVPSVLYMTAGVSTGAILARTQ